MPNELPKPHMRVERTAPPVVENPTLPLMTGRAPRPRLIGGKQVLMATEPAVDKGTPGRMAPLTPTGRPKAQPKQHPPMQRPKAPRRSPRFPATRPTIWRRRSAPHAWRPARTWRR